MSLKLWEPLPVREWRSKDMGELLPVQLEGEPDLPADEGHGQLLWKNSERDRDYPLASRERQPISLFTLKIGRKIIKGDKGIKQCKEILKKQETDFKERCSDDDERKEASRPKHKNSAPALPQRSLGDRQWRKPTQQFSRRVRVRHWYVVGQEVKGVGVVREE